MISSATDSATPTLKLYENGFPIRNQELGESPENGGWGVADCDTNGKKGDWQVADLLIVMIYW
jgi:hypothetical protein